MLALINNLLRVSKIYEYICRPFFLYKYLISENPALNSNSACCIVTIWSCQTPGWGAAGRWGMVSTYGILPRRDNNRGCYAPPPLHPFHTAHTHLHTYAEVHPGGLITHKLSPRLQLITMRRVLRSTPFHCPLFPSAWSCTVVPMTRYMVPRPYLYTNIEDMFPFSTFIYTQAPLCRAHFKS